MFKPTDCSIPTVYCGTKKKLPTKTNEVTYIRKGTAYECMKKGYGSGINNERVKNLPKNSLQRIKYVGEIYESHFKKKKINNTTLLIAFSKTLSKKGLQTFLESVFIKKDGVIDKRAYNSTLLYLYNNGVYENLPVCSKIKL